MLTTTGAAVTDKLNDYTDIDIAISHSAYPGLYSKGPPPTAFPILPDYCLIVALFL